MVCVWLPIVFQLDSFLAFSLHPDANTRVCPYLEGKGVRFRALRPKNTHTAPGHDSHYHPACRGFISTRFRNSERSLYNGVFIYRSPNARNAHTSPDWRLTCSVDCLCVRASNGGAELATLLLYYRVIISQTSIYIYIYNKRSKIVRVRRVYMYECVCVYVYTLNIIIRLFSLDRSAEHRDNK